MFTGIVETIGSISSLESTSEGSKIASISGCESVVDDAHEGDSISINGTCLTVTNFNATSFTVGISPETLRRTNLGSLNVHDPVNLERAVSASTRMGGHFVQGHVDTTATILSVKSDGDAFTFRLQPKDPGVLRYIVEKGYVTLDGASLTITKVSDTESWFEVMLIPYTQGKVVMGGKKDGQEVNVEVDMVGKYVEKSIQGYFDGLGSDNSQAPGILKRMIERVVADMTGQTTS